MKHATINLSISDLVELGIAALREELDSKTESHIQIKHISQTEGAQLQIQFGEEFEVREIVQNLVNKTLYENQQKQKQKKPINETLKVKGYEDQ